jgi:chromosome segregation ATPase
LLVEKKDEIITEKEKAIFEAENSLKLTNQKINDLAQQLETFNLVKKDLEKKEERIKTLVIEIEEKIQKELTNKELIKNLEEKLEKAQKSSAKYEIQFNNNVNLLQEKETELENLNGKFKELNNKLTEGEKIEDKLLNDIQKIKDDKLKLESELEKKNAELVELKKKIKLMRREISKSKK